MRSIIPVILLIIQKSASEIDLRFLDETVHPCDNFYQFSCGNFKNYHERPKNQSVLDLFSITSDELVEIGTVILSSPKHENDPIALKKAKAAYKACYEVDEVDTYDYYKFPEKSIIEEFGEMPLISDASVSKVSFSEVAKLSAKFGIHNFFQFLVKNFNPEEYFLMLSPDSIDSVQMIRPRSTKTYDELLDESFKKIATQKFVKNRLLSEVDPFDVFVLKVAKHLLEMNNVKKTDNDLKEELADVKNFMLQLYSGGINDDDMIHLGSPVTLGELQNWTSLQFGDEIDIDWVDFFKQQFQLSDIDITEDFVIYPSNTISIYGILNLIRKTDPKIVKNFLFLRTFLHMAPDSDLPMRAAFEEYYKSTGALFYERSEYCTRKLLDIIDSTSLSFAITNDYVKYHFNINKIPKAVQVIHNTRESFKEALQNYEWLDEESRQNITKKIDNIVVFLGYPNFVDSKRSLDAFYENLKICEWDNYGNAQRIRAFRKAYALKIYEDHDLWTRSPFEVNAYAVRASNRILMPIAMISSSYFHGNNLIFDYSRFGAIIAHEFIHHFDSTGISYDSDAMYGSLLSNASKEIFYNKTNCFVEQYSKFYIPEIDKYVEGEGTLNENLSDNGGLKHSYAAFLKLINHELKQSEEKYTYQQQFFINFATGYCSDEDKSYLQNLLDDNRYSPSRFRVLGTLSNMQEFAEAFNCPAGSKMNPVEKCQLW